MGKPKQQQDGLVPVPILNQLNEYTQGGFILFYFNSESGCPEEAMTFDSPAHSLALQKHIGDWVTAVNDVTIDAERRIIEMASQPPKADDDELL